MIADAHVHLWKAQTGRREVLVAKDGAFRAENRPVRSLRDGLSDFGGEIRQMMPPYMLTGENSPEMLIANMNYAGVAGAVVVAYLDSAAQSFAFVYTRYAHPVHVGTNNMT